MNGDSKIKAPNRLIRAVGASEQMGIASAGDIRRPSAAIMRQEEVGAQLRQPLKQDIGNLPRSVHEIIGLVRSLERDGKRVERNTKALMDFMKEGDGSELSADLLVATAALMAGIPKKQKEKKKRLRDLYFRWARQTTTALITRVIDTFKPKG